MYEYVTKRKFKKNKNNKQKQKKSVSCIFLNFYKNVHSYLRFRRKTLPLDLRLALALGKKRNKLLFKNYTLPTLYYRSEQVKESQHTH